MDIESFWSWLRVPSNLTVKNEEPIITGGPNPRAGRLYARINFRNGSIRLIATEAPSRVLDVQIASSSTEFEGVELERIRISVEKLLNSKLNRRVYVSKTLAGV